jgi:hypothetical protein
MIVTLTDGEIEVCRMIAQMRDKQNTQINHDKVSNKTQEQQSFEGVMGEVAFAKWKNVYPDLSTEPRKNGYDCVFKEHRVDVKSTNHPTGDLILKIDKDNPDIDIYVLAILHPFHVDIVGWAYKTDLMQPENVKHYGYGPTYGLTQSQLRKFKEDLQHA